MRLKIFSLLALVLFFMNLAPKALAATGSPEAMSLSDAIYADLAMNQELDHVGICYFDGNDNNTVSFNAQKVWYAASTIKLYTAIYAYNQIAAGKISLDEPITINGTNVSPSDSDTYVYPTLQEGDTVSVYRLIDQMITQSDNTAFNTLVDLLDRREITKYIQSLGLANSIVGGKLNLADINQQTEFLVPGFDENATTAQDYAKAFILIDEDKIPGSKDLFDMLSHQKLNTMLPVSLPPDVVVAHKTGELDPFYHDGGIIVGAGKRYVLTIFSDLGDPAVIAHLSNLVYTKSTSFLPTKSDQTNLLNLQKHTQVLVSKASLLHFFIDLGYKTTIGLNPSLLTLIEQISKTRFLMAKNSLPITFQ